MGNCLGDAGFALADDFLPAALAEAMRRDIDAHFGKPGAHRAETHQIWNYWFVPELYTYLRTTPEKIIKRGALDEFFARLQDWSLNFCGMGTVSWPYLSLYVSGCKQGLHNDSDNGRFGFVYSLTRDNRLTTGGETVIFHEGDPFRRRLTRPGAGQGFYDLVAPRFNRLVIFDDRLPHAVERLEGSMDPLEGRFVLHGHLSEGATVATGALPAAALARSVDAVLADFIARSVGQLSGYHGVLTLRLRIAATGSLRTCDILADRVIHPDASNEVWPAWRDKLVSLAEALRFPAADGDSEMILPLAFGPKPARL